MGLADDPTFGPVVVFGRGGTAVEVIDDKALALPPLDLRLAHELIARTRVSRILKAYRDVSAADERAVALVLVTEMINTAIERAMDFITMDRHPYIKAIKDIAAGAVLVASICALLTGLFIFLPKILAL